MRVLGIDCGSEYTGYGVVEETSDRKLVCHVNGAIKLKSGTAMAAKLEKIFTDLTAIIAKHQPEIMAIEDVFYAVNVKSALKLGQVQRRGHAGCVNVGLAGGGIFAALDQIRRGGLRAGRQDSRCSRWLRGF